jgi:DNA-binding CsgD family transcriptional regulator
LLPEGLVAFYEWTGRDLATFTIQGASQPLDLSTSPWIDEGLALKYRPFDPQKPFAHANQLMTIRQWKAAVPAPLHLVKELLLQPRGFAGYSEAILYKGPHYLNHCSIFLPKDNRSFGARPLRLLQSLLPSLTNTLQARKTLDQKQLAPGHVVRIAEAIEGPAFIVALDGTVLFVNAVARALYPRYPEWLPPCIQEKEHESLPFWVKRIPLRIDGQRYWLIISEVLVLDEQSAPQAPWARYWNLPPYLARVAALIMQRQSDKEIATQLRLSLNTVRTYVAELFNRMDIHSRAELAPLALKICEKASTAKR